MRVCVYERVYVHVGIVRGPPGEVAGWGSPLCEERQSVQVQLLLQWGEREGRTLNQVWFIFLCIYCSCC